MDTNALRQKILDLAIRGKLVPQNPSDEPASVLLERIRNEKQQMLRDGKLKASDIKNDTIIFKGEDNLHYEKFQDGTVKCIEDEIPFEVPEGWVWSRLLPLSEKIGAGSTPTGGAAVYSESGVKFIRSQNVYNDGLILDDVAYISEEINQSKSGSIVKAKDILLNITGGSIGRCALVPDNFDIANVNQHVMIIRLVELSFRNYIHNLITSKYIQGQIFSRQIGSGRGGLSAETLSTFLVPVPPLSEQTRIEVKLKQCISTILAVSEGNANIAALLDNTKAKILNLAIRGKLVPQDPNDEPASALLERIRAEKEELIKQGKIKRDKNESVIYKGDDNSYYERFSDGSEKCIDNEVPFELPTGWEWERLGNVATIARGGSPRPIKAFITTEADGINWIKIGDTEKNGKYIFSTREKIKPEGMTKSRYVKSGDFLLTNSMSFGRPYILKTNGCIHDGWLAIGNIESVFDQDFLYYALSSNFMYKILAVLAAGSTVDNLNSDLVKSVLFPIPPIKEQKTICKSVERCILIIDSIIATLC